MIELTKKKGFIIKWFDEVVNPPVQATNDRYTPWWRAHTLPRNNNFREEVSNLELEISLWRSRGGCVEPERQRWKAAGVRQARDKFHFLIG